MYMTIYTYCYCIAGEPFFLNNDEDNIDEQNLFALGSFSSKLKQEKMKKIVNPLARNFVSLLLNMDTQKRLSIPRALQHPFLTGRDAARLPGEEAEFDVFLSYRVSSDAHHASMLYEMLTAKGLKVWWDKVCLEAGVPWDEGFCHGLLKSHAFIPLLSRQAINHPEVKHQNFEELKADSRCDNVYLEHRLALELREMGLVEKIFPVMIGDIVSPPEGGMEKEVAAEEEEKTGCAAYYTHYFSNGCHPNNASKETVTSVETALRTHLDNEGLGSPYTIGESPLSVLSQITQNQGAFLTGSLLESLPAIVDTIVDMIHHNDQTELVSSDTGSDKQLLLNTDKEHRTDMANENAPPSVASNGVGGAVAALKARIASLTEENDKLREERDQKQIGTTQQSLAFEASTSLVQSLQEENNRLTKKLELHDHGDENSSSKNRKNTKGDEVKGALQIHMPTAFAEELDKFDKGLQLSPR
jgi:hypothetical protein